ncbi:MAG: Peroxiredoxin [Phycisphaerales bacterium]|nr:Peroxiredoxin [Phycisphaerales bacterium]
MESGSNGLEHRRTIVVMLMAMIIGVMSTRTLLAGEPATRPALSGDGDVLNFSLLDYRGKHYELRRVKARAVVLFFTGSGCPIARQYAPALQRINEELGPKGIVVWMVNSMPQADPNDGKLDAMYALGRIAPREMLGDRYAVQGIADLVPKSVLGDRETLRQETRDYVWGVPPMPPVLRDDRQLVSRYFGVKRTCDTLVIDIEKMAVIYRGAVDDQFAEGARRPKAKAHYLEDALAEFLAGKSVTSPQTKPHGCAVAYETGPDDEAISYARQVAPLLQKRCVECHRAGDIGPFEMNSHATVKRWSAMIQEVLLDRRMPPWHADPHYGKFTNDRSLTAAEAQTLLRWVRQGCPRGEGEDPLVEAPVAAPPDWALGKPDFLVRLPRQQIPATGVVDYRYIDSDFVMPQDAWLRAAITRPGNRQVIHHIIVRVRYPMFYQGRPDEAYLFTTWVPGLAQAECPAGTGLFVPKGARFNFEIHYTTNGQPQTDESEVGLYLAKEKPKARFETRGSETRELDIPPGDADAKHVTSYCFKKETRIFGLSPHMHVRGSWFKFELLHPDGKRETLLSVPAYDFNWQNGYRLAEPKLAPAGSWLLCTGGFDNSAKNPNNPDSTARVRWGPQSWNEMFMGFMDVAEEPATVRDVEKK